MPCPRLSRWRAPLRLPNDDILHGFRRVAGLSAPGNGMRGWCDKTSAVIFGQLLSGMARLSRATGDDALRDKAITLFEGWRETIGPDGDAKMWPYAWDKLVCGLVDLQRYADYAGALPVLEETTGWAARTFDQLKLNESEEMLADRSYLDEKAELLRRGPAALVAMPPIFAEARFMFDSVRGLAPGANTKLSRLSGRCPACHWSMLGGEAGPSSLPRSGEFSVSGTSLSA
jgi:hypothetical protein